MNLLLISIDSLRLDFVSRTSPRVNTPRFDAQVRDFGFSDRCFSVSSATRPVHASLFTGLYPFEHGVLGQRSPLMRPEISHLFELSAERGCAVGGFSEARQIFEGLPFAPHIGPLSPAPESGLRQIEPLCQNAAAPTFLFVHYWSAHTPYGAADGRAFGEVGQLLDSGRVDRVQERYIRAVEDLFERKIAPLLERIDLERWSVFILSDHGESWTPDEPYHGQSLRNAVLRVPLYFHIPFTDNPRPSRPLISLVDLFPTFTSLFDLPTDYRGFGRDIREEEDSSVYLAQIHPIAEHDDLGKAPEGLPLIGGSPNEPQWAAFDSTAKYTCFERRGKGRLERTFTEEQLDDTEVAEKLERAYTDMQKRSPYARLPLEEASRTQEDLLEKRLRDLGYLD